MTATPEPFYVCDDSTVLFHHGGGNYRLEPPRLATREVMRNARRARREAGGPAVPSHHEHESPRRDSREAAPAEPQPREDSPGREDFRGLERVFVATDGETASGRDVWDNLKRLHKHNTGKTLGKDQAWCLKFLESVGIGTVVGSRLSGVRVVTRELVAPLDRKFVISFVLERANEGRAHAMLQNKAVLTKDFKKAWRKAKGSPCRLTGYEVYSKVAEAAEELGVVEGSSSS